MAFTVEVERVWTSGSVGDVGAIGWWMPLGFAGEGDKRPVELSAIHVHFTAGVLSCSGRAPLCRSTAFCGLQLPQLHAQAFACSVSVLYLRRQDLGSGARDAKCWLARSMASACLACADLVPVGPRASRGLIRNMAAFGLVVTPDGGLVYTVVKE